MNTKVIVCVGYLATVPSAIDDALLAEEALFSAFLHITDSFMLLHTINIFDKR